MNRHSKRLQGRKGEEKRKSQTAFVLCGRIFCVCHVNKSLLMIMAVCLGVTAPCLPGFVRHLQEANDALTAEVKRLREVAEERERDAERFKVSGKANEPKEVDHKPALFSPLVIVSQARIRDQDERDEKT